MHYSLVESNFLTLLCELNQCPLLIYMPCNRRFVTNFILGSSKLCVKVLQACDHALRDVSVSVVQIAVVGSSNQELLE